MILSDMPLEMVLHIFSRASSDSLANFPTDRNLYHHASVILFKRKDIASEKHQIKTLKRWIKHPEIYKELIIKDWKNEQIAKLNQVVINLMISPHTTLTESLICEQFLHNTLEYNKINKAKLIENIISIDNNHSLSSKNIEFYELFDQEYSTEKINSMVDTLTPRSSSICATLIKMLSFTNDTQLIERVSCEIPIIAKRLNPHQVSTCIQRLMRVVLQDLKETPVLSRRAKNAYNALAALAPYSRGSDAILILQIISSHIPSESALIIEGIAGRVNASTLIKAFQRLGFRQIATPLLVLLVKKCDSTQVNGLLNFLLGVYSKETETENLKTLTTVLTELASRLDDAQKTLALSKIYTEEKPLDIHYSKLLASFMPTTNSDTRTKILNTPFQNRSNQLSDFFDFYSENQINRYLLRLTHLMLVDRGDTLCADLVTITDIISKFDIDSWEKLYFSLSQIAMMCSENYASPLDFTPRNIDALVTKSIGTFLNKCTDSVYTTSFDRLFKFITESWSLMHNKNTCNAIELSIARMKVEERNKIIEGLFSSIVNIFIDHEFTYEWWHKLAMFAKISSLAPESQHLSFIQQLSNMVSFPGLPSEARHYALEALCGLAKFHPEKVCALLITEENLSGNSAELIWTTLSELDHKLTKDQYNIIIKYKKSLFKLQQFHFVEAAQHCDNEIFQTVIWELILELNGETGSKNEEHAKIAAHLKSMLPYCNAENLAKICNPPDLIATETSLALSVIARAYLVATNQHPELTRERVESRKRFF